MLCLLLAGCSGGAKIGEVYTGEVNTYEGVTMTAVEGTAKPGGITIEILNTTNEEIESGNQADFAVQVEKNGEWYRLKEPAEWANTAEAWGFLKNQPVTIELRWNNRYGALPEGHYRVVKSFVEYHETGEQVYFTLAVEFEIS